MAFAAPDVCPPVPVQNQFDCIDLSDNALVRVESFPKLTRLKVLLLCNNRITKVGKGLSGKWQDPIVNVCWWWSGKADGTAVCKVRIYCSSIE